MSQHLSLDGRTFVGVENEGGEVSGDTTFQFEQDGDVVTAHYAGGTILEGFLTGTFDGHELDIRYVQLGDDYETATGHSVGEVKLLDDGRVRIEDEWEWESKPGGGRSVLEEVAQNSADDS
ncbi:hypothetical protein ACH9L7_07325 [Haloferax sp. S1W]|uniref:hypothetical protein n=1 Tax=Haloferax sp. S1W TaxID=3377110 RepID=UPI0037C93F6F